MTATQVGRPALLSRAENRRRILHYFLRNRLAVLGLVVVVVLIFLAVAGAALAPYPDHIAGKVTASMRLRPPSATHWFGTNELGQDVLSLVLAGTRISLLSGIAVVAFGALAGIAIGAVAGYLGGWLDEMLMRFTDLMLALPSLILAMAVAAALGPGLVNMIFAIAMSWWPGYARLVRGEVLAKKEEMFVVAARAIGAGGPRILMRHILPNVVSPIVVKMSLDIGFAILTVASLGFIGIGVKPPTPEWGILLSVARVNMPDSWWTAIFPGLAIFTAVFAFNLLGDGLRDTLDPQGRR